LIAHDFRNPEYNFGRSGRRSQMPAFLLLFAIAMSTNVAMDSQGVGTREKAGAKCRAVKPRGLTALRFPRMGSGCMSPRGEANPSYGCRAVKLQYGGERFHWVFC